MDVLIEKLSFLDLNLKTEQEQVVKELYSGRDVLAMLPTGFGKSRIFTSVSETETRTDEEQQDGERRFPCDGATKKYYWGSVHQFELKMVSSCNFVAPETRQFERSSRWYYPWIGWRSTEQRVKKSLFKATSVTLLFCYRRMPYNGNIGWQKVKI